MKEFQRNLVIGVFVLAAIAALGVMIILFGEYPRFWITGYQVTIYFSTAGPISPDDPVTINGVQVGEVKEILHMPDIRKGVKLVCRINEHIDIPIDTEPLLKEQSLGWGKPTIRIDVGPNNSSIILPKDGTGALKGTVAQGIAEVIPKDIMKKIEDAGVSITNLANALKPVADDLHVLLRPQPLTTFETTTKTATGPTTRPIANLSTAVQRLDLAIKNFNDVIANPQTKYNITTAVNNFKDVSANLIESTDKLSQIFNKLNQTAEKLYEGKGAAGKFFNDPELYDALTFTAQKLQLAVDELRNLIQQWNEKGLKIQGGILAK